MKNQHFFLILAFLIIGHASCFAQNFIPGKLYLKINDVTGIPRILIHDGDTMVTMEDQNLLQLYRDNHVYSFSRAFPIADSMKSAKKYGLDKVYTLSCNCDEDNLLNEIMGKSSGLYDFVEKIPIYNYVYTPNDYHLQDFNPQSGPDSALNLIKAEGAWVYSKGDSNVLIGIVDENLMANNYWNHEDINGKIVYWDTVDGNSEYFHGLFVAGCAAGNTDNGVGKSSIGNKCRLMFSSHSWSTQGLLTLSLHGAKVLNASWGSYDYSNVMQLAINAVTDNGTLVVAAAGNLPNKVTGKFGYYYYPASNNNVLSVTSIDYNDHFLTWDTTITARHFNYNDSVDICAPGYHVVGLWDSCSTCYKRSSGTSFASPIVAGTAGLIFSINPCLKPSDVTYILKSTANDTIYSIAANQPFQDSLGSGRLDASAALWLADSYYKPQDYFISNGQNISWTSNKYVANEIIIAQGGTLTVHSTVFLNPNARITIQRGGKLVVDGGKLTSNCSCDMWSGIDVWGNRSLSQYYQTNQGVAIFQNGAIVENAITAVRTLRPTPIEGGEWSYEYDYTGGIIIGNDAIFRNNQRAICFLPYENHHPVTNAIADNYSLFSNCIFETTDTYIDTSRIVNCFIDMDGVRGIKIYGCKFRNNQTGAVAREHLGNGINSISSSFYVKECCLDNYVPCTHIQPTSFLNLNYGIKALGTDPVKTVLIDKSLFSNNYTGIYLGSIQQATITRDTFYVRSVLQGTNNVGGGLYLDECHNYTVTENYFYSNYSTSVQTQAKSVGVAINNSNLGTYVNVNNEIYNNRFEKLNYGILPMNKNRNTNGSYGLVLKCNDFIYPNEYDIAVTKEAGTSLMGIRYNQGSNSQNATDPAGNTFSYTWTTTGAPYSDYYNEGENLIYWHHANDGGSNIVPWHHSVPPFGIVDPQQVLGTTYTKPISCPSILSTGGGGAIEDLLTKKIVSEEKADSVSGLLALLVDGGDTPGTNSYIQTSTSFQTLEVRDDLLSKTPYLSDSVLLSAATKEDVLPPAIITEILTANPQAGKSDNILQILENRAVPLTENQLANIQDGLFIVGAKESLEAKLAGYKSDYNSALRMILLHYKNDSLNPLACDSVIWYLNAENQLWAKYTLAFEYLRIGDIEQGVSVLNNIPFYYSLNTSELLEHQQYQSFFNLEVELWQQAKSIPEVDSAQIQTLISLFNNSNGLIAGYARNILVAKGLTVYHEPYILPTGEVKFSKIRHKHTSDKCDSNKLKIYPNPARDYIIIEFTLNIEPENAVIRIYDVNGKILQQIPLENTNDYLVVPVNNLPIGSYLCSIIQDDKPIQNSRFILVK